MHSREEGGEKEEQELPRAPSCCSTTFPAPIIRGEPNIRSSASTVDMNVTEENERRQ